MFAEAPLEPKAKLIFQRPKSPSDMGGKFFSIGFTGKDRTEHTPTARAEYIRDQPDVRVDKRLLNPVYHARAVLDNLLARR